MPKLASVRLDLRQKSAPLLSQLHKAILEEDNVGMVTVD
jgi:hypothetical protein